MPDERNRYDAPQFDDDEDDDAVEAHVQPPEEDDDEVEAHGFGMV